MNDILVGSGGELLFQNGDLVVGESAEQDVDLITVSASGEWKQWPRLGFGLVQWSRRNVSPITFKQRLAAQLEQDGFSEIFVELGKELKIKAYRK